MARIGAATYRSIGAQKKGIFQFLPVPTVTFKSRRSCSPYTCKFSLMHH